MSDIKMTAKIGDRFSLEMAFSSGNNIRCEWLPYVPDPQDMTESEMHAYRVARDSFIAEYLKQIGDDGAALVIEVK